MTKILNYKYLIIIFLSTVCPLVMAENPACEKQKEIDLVDSVCITLFKNYEKLSNANTDIDNLLPAMKTMLKARSILKKMATIGKECNADDYNISGSQQNGCNSDDCREPADKYMNKICKTLEIKAKKINHLSALCPESFTLSRSASYLVKLKKLFRKLKKISPACDF